LVLPIENTRKYKKNQLIESLKSEVNSNLEILGKGKPIIEEKHEKINDILGYMNAAGTYFNPTPVRKVALEYISRQENLVILNALTIERSN